jgi:hypothetical protein
MPSSGQNERGVQALASFSLLQRVQCNARIPARCLPSLMEAAVERAFDSMSGKITLKA